MSNPLILRRGCCSGRTRGRTCPFSRSHPGHGPRRCPVSERTGRRPRGRRRPLRGRPSTRQQESDSMTSLLPVASATLESLYLAQVPAGNMSLRFKPPAWSAGQCGGSSGRFCGEHRVYPPAAGSGVSTTSFTLFDSVLPRCRPRCGGRSERYADDRQARITTCCCWRPGAPRSRVQDADLVACSGSADRSEPGRPRRW